jgi:hypothetical protein
MTHKISNHKSRLDGGRKKDWGREERVGETEERLGRIKWLDNNSVT